MSVRMGFIGTGGIAQGHMDRLAAIDGVEMVSFCDVEMDRAQAAAEKFSGSAYDSFEKMLDGEDLSAVFIGTPPFAHGDIELACCEKGLSVRQKMMSGWIPISLRRATLCWVGLVFISPALLM